MLDELTGEVTLVPADGAPPRQLRPPPVQLLLGDQDAHALFSFPAAWRKIVCNIVKVRFNVRSETIRQGCL